MEDERQRRDSPLEKPQSGVEENKELRKARI
jgi:hypothetical protein